MWSDPRFETLHPRPEWASNRTTSGTPSLRALLSSTKSFISTKAARQLAQNNLELRRLVNANHQNPTANRRAAKDAGKGVVDVAWHPSSKVGVMAVAGGDRRVRFFNVSLIFRDYLLCPSPRPLPPPWTPLMADRRAHKFDTLDHPPPLVTAHQLDFPSVRLDAAVGRNTALLLHIRSPFRALYPIPTQPFRQLNLAINAQLAYPARILTGRQHVGRCGSTRCRFDSRLERYWSWRSHRRAQVWPRRRCRGHDMEQGFEGIERARRCGRVLGRSLGRGGEEGTPEMEGRPGVRRNDDESQRERTVHSDRVSATVFLGLGR